MNKVTNTQPITPELFLKLANTNQKNREIFTSIFRKYNDILNSDCLPETKLDLTIPNVSLLMSDAPKQSTLLNAQYKKYICRESNFLKLGVVALVVMFTLIMMASSGVCPFWIIAIPILLGAGCFGAGGVYHIKQMDLLSRVVDSQEKVCKYWDAQRALTRIWKDHGFRYKFINAIETAQQLTEDQKGKLISLFRPEPKKKAS